MSWPSMLHIVRGHVTYRAIPTLSHSSSPGCKPFAVRFLKKKQKEQLADGVIISKGRDLDGSLILEWNEDN